MKKLKKIFSISVLITIILALSVANAAHAVGMIGTITVGGAPPKL